MGNDYQLVNPVLIVISIGLIAYLAYLISLMILGSALRVIENVILILVVISVVVIVIFTIRGQGKLRERLNIIWRSVEEIVKRGEKEITGGTKPKEEEKVELPKEETEEEKAEVPKKETEEKEKAEVARKEKAEQEREKKIRSMLKKRLKKGTARRERPKIDKEKLEGITKLLETGVKLSDTDIKKAKEAFIKAKNIYSSMSPEERRLIDEEVVKTTDMYDKIVKKSRGKKG